MVVWSDINDYKGCVILKVEHDSVGTIDTYHYTLRDALTGEFYKIPINPNFHFFEEGDTIKINNSAQPVNVYLAIMEIS